MSESNMDVDEYDERNRFELRLLIRHPDINPHIITEKLGLVPQHANLVGTARTAPSGAPIPGVHKTSWWSHSIPVEKRRLFFVELSKLVGVLEPHADFLAQIVAAGGHVVVSVHLPGDANIGDVMRWRELARLVALKIDLGVEVFPDFN